MIDSPAVPSFRFLDCTGFTVNPPEDRVKSLLPENPIVRSFFFETLSRPCDSRHFPPECTTDHHIRKIPGPLDPLRTREIREGQATCTDRPTLPKTPAPRQSAHLPRIAADLILPHAQNHLRDFGSIWPSHSRQVRPSDVTLHIRVGPRRHSAHFSGPHARSREKFHALPAIWLTIL